MVSNEINDLFNSNMSYGHMRIDYGNTPSVYITKLKLKKALKELSHIDIEEIFEEELTDYSVKRKRVTIIQKIEHLQKWQLFQALNVLLAQGRIEVIEFVVKCKETDDECN